MIFLNFSKILSISHYALHLCLHTLHALAGMQRSVRDSCIESKCRRTCEDHLISQHKSIVREANSLNVGAAFWWWLRLGAPDHSFPSDWGCRNYMPEWQAVEQRNDAVAVVLLQPRHQGRHLSQHPCIIVSSWHSLHRNYLASLAKCFASWRPLIHQEA